MKLSPFLVFTSFHHITHPLRSGIQELNSLETFVAENTINLHVANL